MPTYETLQPFLSDWETLSPAQKKRFLTAVSKLVSDLHSRQGLRQGLRVKGVQGFPGVYEMTWANDGRATFEYGVSPHQGDVHIIWRRIGTHAIFAHP